MHTNFCGRGFFSFRDYGYLSKTAKFPFRGMDYSPWSLKNLINRNRLKKYMQVGIEVMYMYMHASFVGCGFFSFGDMATFQKRPNFPFGAWTIYSPWSSKNLIHWNRLKNFMQVGIDVECMYASFGGRCFFGFRDMATFQKRPNFPFGAWTIVHGHQKISSIGIGSKNSCK